jgi:DNA-binding MarR family transcriptional regulator
MERRKAAQEFFQEVDLLRRLIAARMERGGPHAPTPARIAVLHAVAEDGPCGIKAIAEKFGMTSSAVTQLVNGLVDDGLLSRSHDADDARKTVLQMTPRGKRALATVHRLREKVARSMFEAISDEELRGLRAMHRKMIDHLQLLWTKEHPPRR